MFSKLQALFHPDQFQGIGKKKSYFEGWYYKIVTADETRAFAIIPGIAMDANANKQAFIQVLDGIENTAKYHKFDITEFHSKKRKFKINIDKNYFSNSKIELDFPSLQGKLKFSSTVPWPNPWYSPGIMGPFTFMPFMECNHGILSMNHSIEGKLKINGEVIDFTNGRGYIEKDWGHSFPSAYFWIQSNHFGQNNISFKASVAKIPWLGFSFTGFIAGIWLNNKLIRFTTYNGTKLLKSFANEDNVELIFENNNYRLEVLALREKSTSLASPILGFMDGKIEESMTSRIHILLIDKKTNTILLDEYGRNAALEVAGKISEIFV